MVTVEEYETLSDEDKAKFWGDLKAESVGRLMKWSVQLKIPLDELRDRFIAKMVAITDQLKAQNFNEEQIEAIARKQFANEIRPGRSRAETFEGMVLGWGPLKDWNEFFFNVAKAAFNKDPLQARMDGLCDDNGIALVTTEIKERKGQYFRQNVGEPLQHQWERTVLGIGRPVQRKEGEDTMRIYSIRLSGEPARFADPEKFPQPQMGLVCRWRCNVQEINVENNWVRANGATITAFEPAVVQTKAGAVGGLDGNGNPILFEVKKCAALLDQTKEEFRSSIEGLKEWVAENSKKAGYFAVVKGEILNMYERAIRIGNADQLDLEDIPSVVVNLDPKVPDQMFYGENSTVICATLPYLRTARERDENGQWVEAKDEVGNPKKEVVADGIAIFPIVAMPKAPAVPAAPKPEEPKEETPPPAPPTIEL